MISTWVFTASCIGAWNGGYFAGRIDAARRRKKHRHAFVVFRCDQGTHVLGGAAGTLLYKRCACGATTSEQRQGWWRPEDFKT